MSGRTWNPPAWLQALAEGLIPKAFREEFLGDLTEAAQDRPPNARTLWLLAQLVLSAPALLRFRIRRTFRGGAAAVFAFAMLGLLWSVADHMLRPGVASAAFFTVAAVMNGIGAFLILDRTPFKALAAVTALGALESLAAAVAFALMPSGVVLGSPLFWVIGGASFALYVGVWLRSRRADPEAWRRWEEAARGAGVLDFLAFGHIPHMERERRT